MIPTAPLPQSQAPLPTHAATAPVAVHSQGQAQKQLHVAVDSSPRDQRSDNNKAKGDQKEGFTTQKAEGDLGAVRRKEHQGQRHTQQQNTQAQQLSQPASKPAISAHLSYADKLSALAGLDKSQRPDDKKTPSHLHTIEPHLARHGDGSVTAGLATSRLLSDLDTLIGEDVYADAPPLTTPEGTNAYGKTNALYDRLSSTSESTDIQS